MRRRPPCRRAAACTSRSGSSSTPKRRRVEAPPPPRGTPRCPRFDGYWWRRRARRPAALRLLDDQRRGWAGRGRRCRARSRRRRAARFSAIFRSSSANRYGGSWATRSASRIRSALQRGDELGRERPRAGSARPARSAVTSRSSATSIDQVAAVQVHRHRAVRPRPSTHRGHRGRAGAGAGRERLPRSALPDPHAQDRAAPAAGRTRRWCGWGTTGGARSAGRQRARSSRSGSSTSITQCGLPDRDERVAAPPAARRPPGRWSASDSSEARPASIVTRRRPGAAADRCPSA